MIESGAGILLLSSSLDFSQTRVPWVHIDPATRTDPRHYLSFARSAMPAAQMSCGVTGTAPPPTGVQTAQRTAGPTLRTYRLAVAATGEYTQFHGGTVALAQAAIATTVNRLRGIYEKELAVSFTLVNNASIIYTNSGSDPYTNTSGDLAANQTTVNSAVGSANYDIGHLMGTGGGGVAGLGVVCLNSQKARGLTGSPAPVGDAFDVDYVAHEIGHQFGANHTFNSTADNCGDGNRNASTAYEPGSGTTIMAYAGICSPDNVQNNSDAYFHVASYEEIQTYLATTSCGTSTATNNTAPGVVLPASGKVLPIGTPFKLTATGSDAEGDALTYCWEEYDLGPAASPTAAQVANSTVPLFRSFTPSTSPTRYFPRLSDIIANTTTFGERLPTVTRALNFRVTVRDQHSGAAGVVGGLNSSGTVALSVSSATGPFLVTAPNTNVTWAGNSTQNVTWSVAGTTGSGVNCASVNILLSTNGGLTYPTVLLAGTPNDGSASITVPSVATSQARIMVEAADNYFFDISNANFTITSASTCAAPTSLSVGSITQTSASVSFTASASATSYTVTTTPATTSQSVNGTTAALSGLTAGTNYTVNIVSNCAAGATSVAATASFTTASPPACNAPTSLAVGSITSSSASVSFTASGTATDYTVTTTPATTSQTVSGSPVSLTGLAASTGYTVNIVSNCAGGATSTAATASFVTRPGNDECATPITLTSAVSCTTTSGTVSGATQSQAPATCNSATSSTAFDVWYSFTATGPSHTITIASGFDVVVEIFSGACGTLTSLGCRDATGAGGETFALTTLTAGTVYKVRVYPYDTAPANGSFTICVTGPVAPVTCPAPTSLSVSSITSSSASVSFTPSGAVTGYTVTTLPATSSQTVNGSPVSLTGLAAGTNYTVRIVSNCPGETSTQATATFTTGPAPVVSSVTTATGITYPLGATIPVTVQFSQGVTVTGAPTLALTIGATVRQASYSAANSSGASVRFEYVVQPGDLDTNGIAIGSISLNGGTIRNAAGTNAILTLNSVTNTNTTRVDGVVPTVTSINRQTPATALTTAASVAFRVTFSENVTGVDLSDFSLTTTGTVAGNITSVSGSASTFDVTVSSLSGSGTLRLDLNASGTSIRDAATNPVGGFTAGQTYTVDRDAPNTTIDSNPALATTNTSATFTFSGTDGAGSGVASFQGSLDGAPFTTVTSPLTFNGLALGNHNFQVRAVDGAGQIDPTAASYSWTVLAPAPAITGFTPTSGLVGTVVTITGTNLAAATAVSFNGTAASFSGNTATSITATVPAGATTGPISVTTAGGTGTSSTSFTVTTRPVITALAPVRNLRNAARSSNVAVTFDQPVTAGSATGLRVFSQQRAGLLNANSGGTGSVSGSTITFNPTGDFKPGETVMATISAAVQGTSGNTAASGHVYQFTAAAGAGPGTFVPGSNVTVGNAPEELAAGDLDGDGDLDFAVVNSNDNTVSVAMNAGNGTYSVAATITVGNDPWGVALGDVNGDGHLDILTSNSTGFSVSVLLNSGTGTFGSPATVPVGSFPRDLALGDVDADGDLDLVTSNQNATGSVSVRLNNGNGTFANAADVLVLTNPRRVALADVNNDGRLDLLAASDAAPGAVSVRLGNGSGGFGGGTDVAVANNPRGLAVGDVNNDGHLDLLTASSSANNVSVRLGDGTGSFSGAGAVAVGSGAGNVVLGDINGDGNLDLLSANATTSTISIAQGAGDGNFATATTTSVTSFPQGLTVADVDGDLDLDILAASGLATVNIRLNQSATPAPTVTNFTPASGPVGTTVTITGTGFTGASGVSFNGTAAAFTFNSATSITATVPAGASTGTIAVTTGAGTGTSPGAFTVTTPCNAPSNLATSFVTQTTAQISFTINGAFTYTVTTSPATVTTTVSSDPVLLTGLTPNTAYVVTIVGNCSGGGTSAPASLSFTTEPIDLVVSNSRILPTNTYRNVTITGPTTGGAGYLALGGQLTVTGNLVIMDGGTLKTTGSEVVGPGSFTLAAGGTLEIYTADGISQSGATGDIQVSGTRSFSPDANYEYNGIEPMITGSGLPATVRNLTSHSGFDVSLTNSVTVKQVLTLADAGNLNTNGNTLTLASNAQGTAMVVNGSTGRVLNTSGGISRMQRHITPDPAHPYTGPGYRHYSSPVANAPIADLAVPGVFTPLVNPAANALPTPNLPAGQFPNVFEYQESRLTAAFPSFETGWQSPSSTAAILAPAKGYTVNIAPAANVDLSGQFNNGSVNTGPLTRSFGPNAGWQLFGNPYPAPLNWNLVTNTPGALPAGLENAIYVFEPTSQYGGFYRSFVNGVGTQGFTGVLPAMQGFFVRAAQNVPGGFTFQNSFRVTTYQDPAFYRQAPGTNAHPLLRLRLSGATAASGADEAVVYFEQGATAGTDARLDAPKLPNPGTALSLATQLPGPLSEAMAISALPYPGANAPATRVPLLLTLPTAGSYRFQISLSNFAPDMSVTLVDHATGTRTDLRLTPEYAFTATQAGSSGGRFELLLGRTGSVTATLDGAVTAFSVWPNPAAQQAALHISLATPAAAAKATLHTLLGQEISQRSFHGAGTTLPTAGLAAGTYLLTVQVAGQAPSTHRVVVE